MLVDIYQRRFSYLRLSLLPVCNFRCVYCLPNGNPAEALHQSHLTRAEVNHLMKAMTELGIEKVRLTGGEPSLRLDLLDIASDIARTEGIRKLALTTNGYRLEDLAPRLTASGVHTLNVSVDSLDRHRFFEITKQDRLPQILRGIRLVQAQSSTQVKINVVLLKDLNDDEVDDFILWSTKENIHVRFIELMPTGDNGQFFSDRHLDLAFLPERLKTLGWLPEDRDRLGGPAEVWGHAQAKGKIGLIRPYSKDFCNSCNRLRVTSRGELQLCLFGKGNFSLRPWLRAPEQKEELKDQILTALGQKRFSHSLHEGDYGHTRNLAAMGG